MSILTEPRSMQAGAIFFHLRTKVCPVQEMLYVIAFENIF